MYAINILHCFKDHLKFVLQLSIIVPSEGGVQGLMYNAPYFLPPYERDSPIPPLLWNSVKDELTTCMRAAKLY